MSLHVAVVPRPTGNFEVAVPAYFEVRGPAGLSGTALAEALGELGHGRLWPDGDVPLDRLGDLPGEGMLTLTPFARSATSRPSAAEVRLVAVNGPDCGQFLNLTRGSYSIGRGDCDLHTSDPALSRHHADIVVDQTSIALIEKPAIAVPTHGRTRKGARLMGIGDEFVLGNTTFRLCRLQTEETADGPSPASAWPPEKTTLRGSAASSRPWMMMTSALLPLVVGVVLALTVGSWIFLAFSALGLATGGVPAISELAGRRNLRQRIRILSNTRIAELDVAIPPVGLFAALPPGRSAQVPAPPSTSAVHPLRCGSGDVVPPLALEPPSDRGPQVLPVTGPVVVTVSPGCLGSICGTGAMLGAVIRAAVLQLAYSCSRVHASLVIVGGTDELPPEARYLPGVLACQNIMEVQAVFSGLPAGSVVLALPGVRELDRLLSWVATSAADGISPCIISTGAERNGSADWIIDTTESRLHNGGQVVDVKLDGISRTTLAQCAVSAEGEIQPSPVPPAEGESIMVPGTGRREDDAEVWKASSGPSLHCRLGQAPDGPLILDFVCDGPHVLVTGTTGSGKSELLKSLTMDLLRRYGPDQLSLVLLDFKGGSTLGPFAGTPHCQSVVTDLNVESGERVLAGLRVELRRRESLFRAADVEDYPRYRRQAPSDAPPLPRLLVIVDEFRVLTDEMPDAEAELMRIATVGRSLGVHLLLSTQRPQGVVTASMRANINTVVSLRLLSPSDSQELLGSNAAAALPVSQPGLGFMRRAGEAAAPFRSVPVDPGSPTWSICELGPGFQDRRLVSTVCGRESPPTAPALVLAALTAALPSPALPVASFAPPLPAELHFIPGRLRRRRPAGAVALGLADDIEHQRLTPLWWHPAEQRRLAVVAGPGSTAPAAVLRIVQSLARDEPERHIYVLDGAGYFLAAAGLARVAGYVGVGEPERIFQLLDVFAHQVDAPVRRSATRVLVVSGLAALATTLGASAFAELDERIAALARTADQRDASLIVIGDRDLLSSRFHALAEHRLYLRFGLGQETVLGWPRLRHTAPFPGRAVWTGPAMHERGIIVQLCTPPPSAFDDAGPIAELPLQACLPLPSLVPPDGVPCSGASPGRYPIAVIGPDNRAWSWTPGRVGVVLGGVASGKSNVIRLLARQLGTQFHAGHQLASDGPAPDVLLLDDVLELSDEQLARVDSLIRSGTHVVMTAAPDRGGLMRLPPAARLLPPSAFMLLNPRQASDGDLPGWRLQPHCQPRPGRAVVMVDGQLAQAQCAWAEGPR